MHHLVSFADMLQSQGVVYSKEELLEIYLAEDAHKLEFADHFQQLPTVTTPEFLAPLAMIPISAEEMDLRAAPIAAMSQICGRGASRGFRDLMGKGRGRGRSCENESGRELCGPRNLHGGEEEGQRWTSDDVRLDGCLSIKSFGAAAGSAGGLPAPRGLPAAGQALWPLPTPTEWFYQDIEHAVQGPFPQSQVSGWFSLGYLPENLRMRSNEDPPDHYVPLSELIAKHGGEPPFVKAYRAQEEFSKAAMVTQPVGDKHQKLQQKQPEREDWEYQRQRQQLACEQALWHQDLQLHEDKSKHTHVESQARTGQQAIGIDEEALSKIFEIARREEAETAKREGPELRQRDNDSSSAQSREHARLLDERKERESVQQHVHAEAKCSAKQQAEASKAAHRQKDESPMRRNWKPEAVTRQQAALEEHRKAVSVIPQAASPDSCNTQQSLQKGSDAKALPCQQLQEDKQLCIGAPQLERLWSQPMPSLNARCGATLPKATLPELQAFVVAAVPPESPGVRNRRGHGRSSCSAAHRSSHRSHGDSEINFNCGGDLAQASALVCGLGGMLVPSAHPIPGTSLPSGFVSLQHQQLTLQAGGVDVDKEGDARGEGKEGKHAINAKAKEVKDGAANEHEPTQPEQARTAPSAPAPIQGWTAQPQGVNMRPKTLPEIQKQEEVERKAQEACTKAAAASAQASAQLWPGLSSAWANMAKHAVPSSQSMTNDVAQGTLRVPTLSARRPTASSHLSADRGMLWDYSTEDMTKQQVTKSVASNQSLPGLGVRVTPGMPSKVSTKKKKGKGAASLQAC
tara:strand:- start:1100 stop:3499 length:2400 start_codon:yes stop_codon:yes gene_type:complete